ncbi:Os03g0244650, partial [Oryza sativa Japonica Group]
RRRRERRPGGVRSGARRRQRGRRALVALGEEPERVDLADEVGHAGPAAEPEADHQHPRHHERVDDERARPSPHEPRRRLHGVLHVRGAEGDHVREGGDDVDGEADEEGADGGVDGPEEGEDDGEEPDGHDDGEPRGGALEEAAAVVESDELLPDEVERRAGEAEGDELVDEHEHHGGVPERRARQQRQRIRVREQLVPERPVHARRRRQRQRQHVQRRHQVDRLELLRPPHRRLSAYTVTACPPKV